jgi:hypothetical protein
MQAPALHAWVRDDLARLAKVGIVPTLAEVVWLAELAKAAHTPPGREVLRSVSAPLQFCGSIFYPFHLRAQYWFAEWREVFDGNQLLQDGIYLFAHVHSKPGDTMLLDLATADSVADAVKAWMKTQEFAESDLATLINSIYRMDHEEETIPSPDKKPNGEPQSYVTMEERVASLCDIFPSSTPQFWTSEISAVEAERLAAAMISETGENGAWATSALRTRRVANYMNAVKWIVQRASVNA